jgi:hypothetical protein
MLFMLFMYEGERQEGDDQGFVTSANRFANRKKAYRIHFPHYTGPAELHSDDFYQGVLP